MPVGELTAAKGGLGRRCGAGFCLSHERVRNVWAHVVCEHTVQLYSVVNNTMSTAAPQFSFVWACAARENLFEPVTLLSTFSTPLLGALGALGVQTVATFPGPLNQKALLGARE